MEANQEKEIVLVRHAQSEENVKIEAARAGIERIKKAQLPLTNQWSKSFSLLRMDLDQEVSDLGKRQIEKVATIIKNENFVESFSPELFVHSPLRRARETARGLFPGCDFIQVDCLRESAPHELIFSHGVHARIREFEQFLADRTEKRIVVVGHCRFYKMMTGSPALMDNCSALKYTFKPSREEKWQVQGEKLFFPGDMTEPQSSVDASTNIDTQDNAVDDTPPAPDVDIDRYNTPTANNDTHAKGTETHSTT